MFTAKLRRVGNSLSVLVPKSALLEMKLAEGDEVEVALLVRRQGRLAARRALMGSVPSLGPFERDRNDRY